MLSLRKGHVVKPFGQRLNRSGVVINRASLAEDSVEHTDNGTDKYNPATNCCQNLRRYQGAIAPPGQGILRPLASKASYKSNAPMRNIASPTAISTLRSLMK